MITPQLNINGSSAADLIEPRLKPLDHLIDAMEALRQVMPNGRDYPTEPSKCTYDRGIMTSRLNLLTVIRDDIYAEAIAIKSQQKEY
jgi:hypothetical protein